MRSATDLSYTTYTSRGRALAGARHHYYKVSGGRYPGGIYYTMDDVDIVQTANGWRWRFILDFDESAVASEEVLKHLRATAIN